MWRPHDDMHVKVIYEVESTVTIGDMMHLHVCFLDSRGLAGSISWIEVKEAFLD